MEAIPRHKIKFECGKTIENDKGVEEQANDLIILMAENRSKAIMRNFINEFFLHLEN